MLSNCQTILDLRDCARRRLPAPIFDMMDGAAETEFTARRNTAAFDEIKLVSRCLIDVGRVNTTTRVLGQQIEWPVFCSPTGGSRLFHVEGELAVARAAASAGTLYGLSTASTYSIEEVAAASNGPKVFQLYICRDRDLTRALIDRAKRSGYGSLCVTVDTPVVGQWERDYRAGLSRPLHKWPLRTVMSFAQHPSWVARRLGSNAICPANFSVPNGQRARAGALTAQLDPSITWKDVRDVRDLWDGPFALKGVMSAEDACRAADLGVTTVIVSNHGGRQLDGAASPIEVLPEIVRAVGDRIEVILDGGIRRGVHVLKALALGAKACSVGRPYLYGLSAGGEAGVVKALSILRSELVRAMQLCGCADLKSVDERMVRRF
jgi:L-lactate dehydrogenase (cytochrome)